MRCHRCGSGKVEADVSLGTTVCVNCGEVLEENRIVAEVAFQELAGGKTVLQGAFAGESGRISTGGPFGRGRGKEGQEQAIDNGRQKIARLAHALRLPERYRESAQRYYNLAVVHRFTRGRRSENVAAICLYMVCRYEHSSHMLIDFSDLLQTNVFVLGATFLKLVRVLCLELPLIDPSIYISRFAAALDFGDYTQRVAQDAVRLVQRMDRDWIRTGRRPGGICGACLLISARINGFRRSIQEMIYVVKVADATIQKRLKEFGETESATLTVRNFRTLWLEAEADPPAFAKTRKPQKSGKGKGAAGAHNGEEEDEGEEWEDEDEDEEEDMLDEDEESSTPRPSTSKPALSITEDEDATQVERPDHRKKDPNQSFTIPTDQNVSTNGQETENEVSTLVESSSGSQIKDTKAIDGAIPMIPELEEEAKELEAEMESFMSGAVKASEEWSQEKRKLDGEENEGENGEEEEGIVNLSDVDDEEIDAMLLTPDEVRDKTAIWFSENREYLDEMEAKAKKIEMDRLNGVYTKKTRGAKKRKVLPQASTPAEAAKQLLQTKKLSRKINQSVFDDMFESPESIARIKEQDRIKREQRETEQSGSPVDMTEWEVVEEPGDAPTAEMNDEEDEDHYQDHEHDHEQDHDDEEIEDYDEE